RGERLIRRAVEFFDERTGQAGMVKKLLRYVFPDHWSFLFGEIALYSFMVLVGTGVYLTLFFEPSLAETTYEGSYAPLVGTEITKAYGSALDLSFDVQGGLLIRQTHHWAALLFVAAIAIHLMRIFFTGAFRKPREINYVVGLSLLVLALLEGFAGYSLLDDLLSGMGLAIAYGVSLSIPVIGGDMSTLIWGGEFPGADAFLSRLYIAHVLIIPVIIGGLIAVHLLMLMLPHHTQFGGGRKRERNVVGTAMWPAYAARATGLLFATAAVLFALGGLVEINPIWLWGPYEIYDGTNGAQPDWYMGWLIGALRLMPPIEPTVGEFTVAGNPFFGGVLFPGAVFGFLFAWPWIEKRVTGDRRAHHLLDRPRDNPWRTAVGAAVFTMIVVVFLAGAADRIFVQFGVPYSGQVWFFRIAFFLLPPVAYVLIKRICTELRDAERHPIRTGPGKRVERNESGGFGTPVKK
ncbi:MAG: cytochrome bc1 complex cytochrome b subunit, partial [Solirubrobacterales bacterium]